MKKGLLLLSFSLVLNLFAEKIRPIKDDVGYCWEKHQIRELINFLETEEKRKTYYPNLIAGIFPHDDYLFAGKVYYPLFKNIKSREVLIFGVTHSTARKEINDPQNILVFESFRFWRGPFKKIPISPLREFLIQNLSRSNVMINNLAHQLEHSIEAAIPFLQYFNLDIQITPILVTGMTFQEMDRVSDEISKLIVSYINKNNLHLGRDLFFLMSADANHYGEDFNNTIFGTDEQAHLQAIKLDKKILNACISGQVSQDKIKNLTRQLWGKIHKDFKNTLWCGKYTIPFGLLTVLKIVNILDQKKVLKGKIFRYSDTYSDGVLPLKKTGYGITAPFSLKHWVGFFSAGFYLE